MTVYMSFMKANKCCKIKNNHLVLFTWPSLKANKMFCKIKQVKNIYNIIIQLYHFNVHE